MSFLGGGDASCSTGANPLNQFSKHVQDDKSLQRDRLVGRGPGGVQEGFRSGAVPGPQGNEMMDEFMNQSAQPPGMPASAAPLPVDQMRREFEQLNTGPAQHLQRNESPSHADWASQFDPGPQMHQQHSKPSGFDAAEFERYAQMNQHNIAAEAQMSNGNVPSASTFQQPYAGMNMSHGPMFTGSMGMGMGMGMQRPYGGGMGFNQMQPQRQDKGKGRIEELDDKDWEAQFAQLDAQPADQVEATDEEARQAMERELQDIDRSVHSQDRPRHIDHFLDAPTEGNLDMLKDFESTWSKIIAETPELRNRAFAKDADNHTADSLDDFSNFDMNNLALNTHPSQVHNSGPYQFELDNIFQDVGNPFEEGVRIMDDGGNLSLAALAFEAAVQQDPHHVAAWTRLGAAQAQNEKETPAMRALEQAIALDPTNLDALMGLAVSNINESYERSAYRFLERWLSLKYPEIVPPRGLEDPLDNSLANTEFGFSELEETHARVTQEFIRAAQLSPDPQSMDPDVQVGLGVLFYGKEEYDKAVDCFSAALQSSETGSLNSQQSVNQRPLLWNRLGATLANSGRSEEAINAYEKALEFNPNFVRARYNLGVSCINIGCYREAAQHLLGALEMHKSVEREGREKAREIIGGGGGGGGLNGGGVGSEGIGYGSDADFERAIKHNSSTNLYDTLRKVFNNMDRSDLAGKVVNGVDPAVFRGEFEF
ncbi:MAG: hypothetical protein Q9159_007378 [Coniocarpon cinnabarinum]